MVHKCTMYWADAKVAREIPTKIMNTATYFDAE